MKVWITKYALTQGILEREVTQSESVPSIVTVYGNPYEQYHGEGRDWHRTRAGAVAVAEAMRMKRIASLKKSLTKISAMSFG
jgi:hypothetical protein